LKGELSMRAKNIRILLITAIAMVAAVSFLSVKPAEAQTQTILYNFNGGPKDGVAASGVILDAAGNLYGTTYGGGTFVGGIAYELSPSASGVWTETVLHYFSGGTDGFKPTTNLVLDAAGNLYGTTLQGGAGSCVMNSYKGCGTVFELSPAGNGSWTEKILYSFAGGTDGQWPRSNLIFDAAGNLYGTTSYGGAYVGCSLNNTAYGCGTVFELTPHSNGTWTKRILHDFGGIGGELPYAGVAFDGSGNLYGTTLSGGDSGCYGQGRVPNCGALFELVLEPGKGWHEILLSGYAGAPDTNVAVDSQGNLYVAENSAGGDCAGDYGVGCGLVFQQSPAGGGKWNDYDVAYGCGFDGPSSVIFDSAGNLYWTTIASNEAYCGQSYPALVIESSPGPNNTWTNTTLFQFSNSAQGLGLSGGLVRDAAGNLYGTTTGGGKHNAGVVYEITP
jgi:uncharacterized repeat protein (TIGR03803 family)